jgi:predicted 3-demethylubiquinone-9 3-methyltransferase (glyoxalase superfamily)
MITPHLWFDNQAEEAVKFYLSIFKNSRIGNITRYGREGTVLSLGDARNDKRLP